MIDLESCSAYFEQSLYKLEEQLARSVQDGCPFPMFGVWLFPDAIPLSPVCRSKYEAEIMKNKDR
jgi:hypothetical protein